jgi:uncharacterized protein
MSLAKNLKSKLNKLESYLKGKKVIVAFSGGVDSSLLAFISKKYAKDTLLITEQSVIYPQKEIEEASNFAKKYNIPHQIIQRDPLNDKNFSCNPLNRCYICKKGLYSEMIQIKNAKDFDIILDGSNLDDLSDYRPGLQALKELNIFTPYIEFKINKGEIRELSKFFKLEVQSKPSMACFSSRIPYGEPITEEKVNMIKEAEKFLKIKFNLKQLRVRYHEKGLARIEILPEDIPFFIQEKNLEIIKKEFKKIGFIYITVDIEGFRSGSMNEGIDLE